jgi:acyl-[acyl-carrier-protein]-phospholipid O-acyltransferase/long-chain-fatty-acid--[acyl-carrier-protein] ligase
VTLVEMFVRTAKAQGPKLAIIDRGTGHRVSYKAALLRTLVLSRSLEQYDPGFIGVMIPNSAGAALTVIAAVMSGRTPVMINYSTGAAQNCRVAQSRLAFRTIITSRALLAKMKIPEVEGMVFIEDIAAGVSSATKVSALLKASLPPARLCRMLHPGTPDDNVVILFTSGSERDPKAVPLSNRNLIANIEAMRTAMSLSPDDIILGNLPVFHVFGLNTNLWLPLVLGMTLVTYPSPIEFRAVCTAIREERITMVVGTPSFLLGYLQKSEPGDFASVRLLVTGADKCPEALRRGYWEKHQLALLEGYGTTETSPVISVNAPDRNRPGSVGRVLPGVQVRMENYETGEACGTGEIGKILVKGDNVMTGYFDDFEGSALKIRHGWYDTGDMGFMDEDGFLWHVGRLARFLKVGGEMVSLVKVEDVLERALPAGVLCSVVEVPDPFRGSKIVAVVTASVDEREVLRQMSGELPNIALPRQFVVVPELPRMSSGKIDFRTLTESVRAIVQKSETRVHDSESPEDLAHRLLPPRSGIVAPYIVPA